MEIKVAALLFGIPALVLALPPTQALLTARRWQLRNRRLFGLIGALGIYAFWALVVAVVFAALHFLHDPDRLTIFTLRAEPDNGSLPFLIQVAIAVALYVAVNFAVLSGIRRLLARSNVGR